MKKILSIIIVLAFLYGIYLLIINKTFAYNEYVNNGVTVFVPRYSYFDSECCHYVAKFYSIFSKEKLEGEIKKYLDSFEYHEESDNKGYVKDNLLISKYEVEEHDLYRVIILQYEEIKQ